jgi:hypothetical protein
MGERDLRTRLVRRARWELGTPQRIRDYRRVLRALEGPQDREVFERLRRIPGLDNGSAHATIMCEAYNRTLESGGDVLECGPGLSTIALEAAARQTGATVYSLEHSQQWVSRTRRLLRSVGARQVELRHVGLAHFGEFDWYDVPDDLPSAFGVVLCDGPPGVIDGGRFGLVPVMGERIAGASILVDDADRPAEAAILARWADEFGRPSEVVRVGDEPAMAVIQPAITWGSPAVR